MSEDIGSLRIIFGPMFSGKSSKLIHLLTTAADVGFEALYIDHILDNRITESGDNIVTTHSSNFKQLSHKIKSIKTDNLSKINISKYQFIGIDEGQFFKNINKIVRDWVLFKNKNVIIASLDGDSDMETFGQVHQLISLCEAEQIEKLYALCTPCLPKQVKASYTVKKYHDHKKNKVDVGGSDKYMAVCLKCFKKHHQ